MINPTESLGLAGKAFITSSLHRANEGTPTPAMRGKPRSVPHSCWLILTLGAGTWIRSLRSAISVEKTLSFDRTYRASRCIGGNRNVDRLGSRNAIKSSPPTARIPKSRRELYSLATRRPPSCGHFFQNEADRFTWTL